MEASRTTMTSSSTAAAVAAASTHLNLKEEDVVKLACEFLQNRGLHISQVTLERETGVINGNYSDDLLFLRQLILDGQWEDVNEFIAPLAALPSFDHKLFQFIILKAKFVELLCIRGEAPPAVDAAVDTVVGVLKEIERVAPSKELYNRLCLLLTVTKLTEHPEYRAWNPAQGRATCFREVLPLVQDLLGSEQRKQQMQDQRLVATNDRLLQLIIKGILYESCVDYCQQKATGAKRSTSIDFTNVLSQSDFSDSDLSLLSWLQSIPADTFACPFEQRSLNVDVERMKAPQLEASWTEHMLVTPIKPNIFPHSAMPSTRPKAADIMAKSLSVSLVKGGGGENGTANSANSSSANIPNPSVLDMSKSLASFHLNGKKMMDASVDHLFKEGEPIPHAPAPPPPPPPPQSSTSSQQEEKEETVIHKAQPQLIGQDFDKRALEQGKRTSSESGGGPPRFLPVCSLEDIQAIRCAEFHPSGRVFAIGSNSKTLRLCQYPLDMGSGGNVSEEMRVLHKRPKHHKGSIYCMAWSPAGDMLATGSNDKTVKLLRFDGAAETFCGGELELTMHDGTVRDCLFLPDRRTLVSAGAGDCKVYLTDCAAGQPLAALAGHSAHVLSLAACGQGGLVFVSGSQDRTVRFWDARTRACVNLVPAAASPVVACTVDPSGRLLVTGHEDATCALYDVRGGRSVQVFRAHAQDVRSVRFSPNAYYLLSGGYDQRLVLTDLQGDLTQPLPSVVVAQHEDKVISGRWHPVDFSFLSTSADKTCTLWALPPL